MWCENGSKALPAVVPARPAASGLLELADPRRVRRRPGLHRACELVVRVRLGVAPLLLERPPEGVVRVVVRGRELEDEPELGLGLLPPLEPEVRDPERLPDRRLLGLEPLCLLERHRRL